MRAGLAGDLVAMGVVYYAVAFGVVWVAVRRWKVRPWAVAAAFAGVVAVLGALAVARIYVPATVEAGEFYWPHFFAGGPLEWLAAFPVAVWARRVLGDGTEHSPMFWIVVVPGVFHALLGAAQGYGLAWLATLWPGGGGGAGKRGRGNVDGTREGGA